MATKTIGIDQEAYELLCKAKRQGETFSDVVKRAMGPRFPISDFAGGVEGHGHGRVGRGSRVDRPGAPARAFASKEIGSTVGSLMRYLDTTFTVDLLRGVTPALNESLQFKESREFLATPAPCVAEVMRGSQAVRDG